MADSKAPQTEPAAAQDGQAQLPQDLGAGRLLDLQECPRCWMRIERIVWGRTNCPGCGLHFECC